MSELNDQGMTSVAPLVAALPEIYQPIYGHPELTQNASRICDDRLVYIEAAWRQLANALGRPPRVLDLGCAQGYVSLHLASLGAPVIGIDHCAENIAVCQALAAEHPQYSAQFVAANLELLFDYFDLSQVDLVLGLSVVHHMARNHGHAAVTQWMTTLGSQVAATIFELALAEEPVHWATAQPADERSFLSGFTFVHELARTSTHLSDVKRPLIFASNYVWYLDGNTEIFTAATRFSHGQNLEACGGTRRYFHNERHIAKVFSLRDAFPVLNRSEIMNEASFLAEAPKQFGPLPQMISCGTNERQAWLVRERIPGELLYDRICSQQTFDAQHAIGDVLKQLAILEAHGLYHNDVKTWNVLIVPNGAATLIDYGSISPYSESFSWPQNLFASFWLFVWCVATGSRWSGDTPAPPFASPHNLPEPYARWARSFWELPPSAWSFRLLLSSYDVAMAMPESESDELSSNDVWRRGVETYMAELAGSLTNIYTAVKPK